MTLASLLPLPVVIPIGGAVLSPLATKLHRRVPLVLGMLAMLGTIGVLVPIAGRVYGGNGTLVAHYFSAEKPVHGQALGIAFAADPFGMAFALLTAGLGLLLLLSLLSELGDIGARELGGLACLTQLLLAALIGAALTADTINLFVWFEVAALSSYGLTGFFLEQPTALEAAFKVMVLTSVGGFIVFVGSAMLYTSDGALNFGQLHLALQGHHLREPELLALGLLLAGFGVKAGLVPFHGWLADAHAQGPSAVSALFSALMVDVGVVAITRLALQVYGPDSGHRLLGLLTGLGIASALAGAAMALVQDNLKRLLAWDTVSQVGLLIVGFASATRDGVAGAVYHLVNHGLFKALLFLCAGAIVHATGITTLSEMGGLVRRRPLLTAGFTVGSLAIAGVPPLNGFVSLGLIHDGIEGQPLVLVLALLAQILTVAALARACYLGFYRRRRAEYERFEPSKLGMRMSLIVLGAGCIAFGAMPYPLLDRVAAPAASILLHPTVYANGVLHGTANVPALSVSFSYGDAKTLGLAAVEIVLGVALAVACVRRGEPKPITWLRRLHTGSVNDYAAFAAGGIAFVAAVLLA